MGKLQASRDARAGEANRLGLKVQAAAVRLKVSPAAVVLWNASVAPEGVPCGDAGMTQGHRNEQACKEAVCFSCLQ